MIYSHAELILMKEINKCVFLCMCSINLMTVMGALANIAKKRPIFFDQVVQSFEALHGMLLMTSL